MLVYWFIKGVSAIFPDSAKDFYKTLKLVQLQLKAKKKGIIIGLGLTVQ
jgi:hypothetical protein